VQAPASLVVRYSGPDGLEQRKVFQVTVEDYWDLLNSLNLFSQGNPYIHPQACVIPSALVFDGCLSEADFAGKSTYTYSGRQVLNTGSGLNSAFNVGIGTGVTPSYGGGYGSSPYGSGYGSGYSPVTPYPGIIGSPSYGYNPVQTSPLGPSTSSVTNPYQPSTAPTAAIQPYPYYNPAPTAGLGMGGMSGGNFCSGSDALVLDPGAAQGGGLFGGSGSSGTRTLEKNGLKVTISAHNGSSFFGGGSSLRVTIDKTNAAKGRTEITENVRMQVRRQSPLGIFDITVPVRVCVDLKSGGTTTPPSKGTILGPDGHVPGAAPAASCSNPTGFSTGSEAYTKAGFNWLLLEWSAEKIAATTCDLMLPTSGDVAFSADNQYNRFCDATQHTIALSKKTDLLGAQIAKIKTALADSAAQDALKAAIGTAKPEDYRTSANLFRMAARQIVITENGSFASSTFSYSDASTAKRAFFVDDQNMILLDPRADTTKLSQLFAQVSALDLPAATVSAADAQKQYANIVSQMDKALLLAAADKSAQEMLVVIDAKSLKPETAPALLKIGANQWTTKGADGQDTAQYFVLTLPEFGHFHQTLSKQISDATVTTPSVNGQSVTLPLLADMLANAKMTIGLEDTLSLSVNDPAFETLLSRMTLIPAVKTADSAFDMGAFYRIVKRPVLLIADTYSDSFKSDFATWTGALGSAGSKISFTPANWTFDVKGTTTAGAKTLTTGVYDAVVDYAWETPKTVVSLTKSASALPSYHQAAVASNPLFNYAFDPLTGATGRDYGTATTVPIQLSPTALSRTSGATALATSVKGLGDTQLHSGVLAQLSGTTLSWSPSKAFAISVSQPATSNGLLYEVLANTTDKGPILNWNGQNGTGTPSSVCGLTGDNSYNLLKGSGTARLFLPSNAANASVHFVCAAESATVTAKSVDLAGKTTDAAPVTVTKDAQGKSLSLPTTPASIALSDLAAGIQKETVCVTAQGTSLTLQWNNAKISPSAITK
jgi:hypothetical protein